MAAARTPLRRNWFASHWNDFTFLELAITGPRFHQLAPLVQGVATATGYFGSIAGLMRQGRFNNLPRKCRLSPANRGRRF